MESKPLFLRSSYTDGQLDSSASMLFQGAPLHVKWEFDVSLFSREVSLSVSVVETLISIWWRIPNY